MSRTQAENHTHQYTAGGDRYRCPVFGCWWTATGAQALHMTRQSWVCALGKCQQEVCPSPATCDHGCHPRVIGQAITEMYASTPETPQDALAAAIASAVLAWAAGTPEGPRAALDAAETFLAREPPPREQE